MNLMSWVCIVYHKHISQAWMELRNGRGGGGHLESMPYCIKSLKVVQACTHTLFEGGAILVWQGVWWPSTGVDPGFEVRGVD